jgi:hypothetical protein
MTDLAINSHVTVPFQPNTSLKSVDFVYMVSLLSKCFASAEQLPVSCSASPPHPIHQSPCMHMRVRDILQP